MTSDLVLPEGVRRLFPHHDVAELAMPEHRAFLVARLLEDGDSADLRWLVGAVGEETLRDFVAGPGTAKLSRRSAAFWSLVLGVGPARPSAEDLWPL